VISFGMMVALVATMKAILLGDSLARPNRKAMFNTLLQHLRMVRLTAIAFATIGLTTGCLGEVTSDSGGGGTSGVAKKKFKEEALPFLKAASCNTCHGGSSQPFFMAGATDDAVYDSMVASAVVNFTAPASSRVLTKGQHSGPALTDQQASGIQSWLSAERDERSAGGTQTGELETAVFDTKVCRGQLGDAACLLNTVALDAFAPGATLTFTMQNLSDGIYINNMSLNAGPTGVFIEHPLFVAVNADGRQIPDNQDRYALTKMNLQTGSEQLEGGTAGFTSFPANPKLKILFKAAKAFQPDGGGDGGGGGPVVIAGCKKVDSFFTNTAPQLQASCVGCHSGGNAKSAVDMTNMGATDATIRKSQCDQILTRVNKLDIDNSGLFLAPRPGNANHPFQFNNPGDHTAFKNPIKIWINEEKTAL
jgi:mono/diheme cytochrome c family protein